MERENIAKNQVILTKLEREIKKVYQMIILGEWEIVGEIDGRPVYYIDEMVHDIVMLYSGKSVYGGDDCYLDYRVSLLYFLKKRAEIDDFVSNVIIKPQYEQMIIRIIHFIRKYKPFLELLYNEAVLDDTGAEVLLTRVARESHDTDAKMRAIAGLDMIRRRRGSTDSDDDGKPIISPVSFAKLKASRIENMLIENTSTHKVENPLSKAKKMMEDGVKVDLYNRQIIKTKEIEWEEE